VIDDLKNENRELEKEEEAFDRSANPNYKIISEVKSSILIMNVY